jgi:trehalose-6-phosphate synthase
MGQFLEGPKYNKVLDADDLYSMLSDFIELNKDGAVERFLKACKKDKQELQYKIIIDKAIRSKVIKYKDKYYQRGQVTLGRSVDEVYTNLSTPEFAAEFLSIKEEIEERS